MESSRLKRLRKAAKRAHDEISKAADVDDELVDVTMLKPLLVKAFADNLDRVIKTHKIDDALSELEYTLCDQPSLRGGASGRAPPSHQLSPKERNLLAIVRKKREAAAALAEEVSAAEESLATLKNETESLLDKTKKEIDDMAACMEAAKELTA